LTLEFNNLCWAKAIAGLALESTLADCDPALALSPKSAAILDSKGLVLRNIWRIALRWVASPLLMLAHPRVHHGITTGRTLDAGSGGLVQDSKSVSPALKQKA
jgi:hypothetical protein